MFSHDQKIVLVDQKVVLVDENDLRDDQNDVLVDQNDLMVRQNIILVDQNVVLVDQKPSGGGKSGESSSLYAPIGCSSNAKRGPPHRFGSDQASKPGW